MIRKYFLSNFFIIIRLLWSWKYESCLDHDNLILVINAICIEWKQTKKAQICSTLSIKLKCALLFWIRCIKQLLRYGFTEYIKYYFQENMHMINLKMAWQHRWNQWGCSEECVQSTWCWVASKAWLTLKYCCLNQWM